MTTMAAKRKPWDIRPSKKSASSIPAVLKKEVEFKARDLINDVLKPKYVRPPEKDAKFNYISDIAGKWYRQFYYFISTYKCPHPDALEPTFEQKFARMEYIGDDKFALYFMRYTGEWVGIHDAMSVDESMESIQDDEWFVP
jgi:hypothetical protein